MKQKHPLRLHVSAAICCFCFPSLVMVGCSGTSSAASRARNPDPRVPASIDDREAARIRLWANQIIAGQEVASAEAALADAGGKAVPVLAEFLPHSTPETRAKLAQTFARIGSAYAVPHLVPYLSSGEPEIRRTLAALAGRDLGTRKTAWLNWWYAQSNPLTERERREIREAFLRQPLAEQQRILQELSKQLTRTTLLLEREDPYRASGAVRSVASGTEGEWRQRHAAVPIVEGVLERGDPSTLWHLPALCRQIGEPAIPALRRGAASADPQTRSAAQKILLEIDTGGDAPVRLLSDPDPTVRIAAARGLAERPTPEGLRALEAMGPEDEARPAALVTLAILKPDRHMETLLRHLHAHPEPSPVLLAELSRLASHHFGIFHGPATENAFLEWIRREGLHHAAPDGGDTLATDAADWERWWNRHRHCRKK